MAEEGKMDDGSLSVQRWDELVGELERQVLRMLPYRCPEESAMSPKRWMICICLFQPDNH